MIDGHLKTVYFKHIFGDIINSEIVDLLKARNIVEKRVSVLQPVQNYHTLVGGLSDREGSG